MEKELVQDLRRAQEAQGNMGPLEEKKIVKEYAFKKFKAEAMKNENFRLETQTEFDMMSKLDNPHIVKYYEL